jgi:hypothetical protein
VLFYWQELIREIEEMSYKTLSDVLPKGFSNDEFLRILQEGEEAEYWALWPLLDILLEHRATAIKLPSRKLRRRVAKNNPKPRRRP